MKVRIVALLAEGVDRNQICKINGTLVGVALLAEGVDRNLTVMSPGTIPSRRPPRGGRG